MFLVLDVLGSLLLGLGLLTWLQGGALFALDPDQARATGMLLVMFGSLLTLPFVIAVIRIAGQRQRRRGGGNPGP